MGSPSSGAMRLNRYLAAAGFGSRRTCEELIRNGRVTLNGQVCTALATQVRPADRVAVSGRPAIVQRQLTLLACKPRGLVCTADDERGRPTILSLLPPGLPRLYPVGRLDRESEGLLLLTNDGALALRLTHPRYKVEKEYEVQLDRPFDPSHEARLLRGLHIPGGRARMDRIEQLQPDLLRVVLTQGIKRQIRLMLYRLGYEVKRLRRIRIGPITDERIRPGQWRELVPSEIARLKEATGFRSARQAVSIPGPYSRQPRMGISRDHAREGRC